MASKNKRRKKLKNVVISNEELTPTVIGYLEEKSASPIFLIFVFGIFLTFLFFIPEVTEYIENYKNSISSGNVSSNPKENISKYDKNEIGIEFDFSDDIEIAVNEVIFSKFKLEGDILSFNVANYSNDWVDFSKKNYYVYIKDSSGSITDIIKITDLILLENTTKDFSAKITSISIEKIFIDELKEEYISEIYLNNNILTCKLNSETYIYEFSNYLDKVTYYYQSFSPSETLKYQFKQKKEMYQSIEGAQITLSESSGLYYEVKFDLTKGDVSKLNDENMFSKDVKPKVVKFKMQEKGFTCS